MRRLPSAGSYGREAATSSAEGDHALAPDAPRGNNPATSGVGMSRGEFCRVEEPSRELHRPKANSPPPKIIRRSSLSGSSMPASTTANMLGILLRYLFWRVGHDPQSIPCHPELGSKRVKDLTTADNADEVDSAHHTVSGGLRPCYVHQCCRL